MEELISTLEAIAIRMDYILKESSKGSDCYMLRKDMKELHDEIRNRVKQEKTRV